MATMADAKQGKPAEELQNGSSQTRILLAKPKLGGFGSSGYPSTSIKGPLNNPFGSVLRPPQLKTSSNPFLKTTCETNNTEKENEKETSNDTENRLQIDKDKVEAPKFVPLQVTSSVTRPTNSTPAVSSIQPTNSSNSSASFIFGQNLSERVVIQEAINNGNNSTQDHSSSNGTSDLLFTNAAATVKEQNSQDEAASNEARSESLAAAAAEYERSHAKPPPATSNCTMTGEEGENNVLQILCRLFAWESGSWRERGRGALRLNDTECGGSRLVARVAGSLRVVLNTKLWPDMVVERAGTKSLRITAADAQLQIKLFLIMGSPGDIAQLHRALLTRIALSKRTTSNKEINTNQRQEDIGEDVAKSVDDDEEVGKSVDDEEEVSKRVDDDNIEEYNEESLHSNVVESERLEESNEETKTDNMESNEETKTDGMETNDENAAKAVKRKEPVEADTSPKRQCPDVSIQ
ncbi:ran-binding protein 3 isoform X2 [Leptidea sinapis]|uniref:ran-binding protein 3 isoform X2 n=1 Tax=Leptidea sinapis TaxID=189913 RepID=UPI0021C43612|nr:ran-binding protein 3 isoform X2 [Leptidea sinapis]